MIVFFGDLSIELDIEWIEPAFYGSSSIIYKQGKFSRSIAGYNDKVLVVKVTPKPNSRFIRNLLLNNTKTLDNVLFMDYISKYGVKHVIVFEDGKFTHVNADAYGIDSVEDCITYYNLLAGEFITKKKSISLDKVIAIVDVKHGSVVWSRGIYYDILKV